MERQRLNMLLAVCSEAPVHSALEIGLRVSHESLVSHTLHEKMAPPSSHSTNRCVPESCLFFANQGVSFLLSCDWFRLGHMVWLWPMRNWGRSPELFMRCFYLTLQKDTRNRCPLFYIWKLLSMMSRPEQHFGVMLGSCRGQADPRVAIAVEQKDRTWVPGDVIRHLN